MMNLTDLVAIAITLDAMSVDELKAVSLTNIMEALEAAYIIKDANDDDIRWLGSFDYVTEEIIFYEKPGLDEIAEFETLLDEYRKIDKIVRVLEDSLDEII